MPGKDWAADSDHLGGEADAVQPASFVPMNVSGNELCTAGR
jgi:hypothetical protein